MYLSRFPTLSLALILFLVCFPHAARAQGDQLNADIRLFTVLAAINVAGYDQGFGSPSDSPVRQQLREDLADFQGASLPLLKNFYEQFKRKDPGANLSQYISFALNCEAPPTFEVKARLPTDLPPDVRRLRTLGPILSEFYREARIEKLWSKYLLEYEAEILRYQEPLIQTLFEASGYLRISPTSRQAQSFKVFFSLLGAPNNVYSRSYQGAVYVVVQSSKKLRTEEIRHAYLLHQLDPLSIRYGKEIGKKEVLSRFALFAPALHESYKSNYQLLVTKSLAKAVEARLASSAEGAAQVEKDLREGFILTPYFYEKLEEFEKTGQEVRLFYADMIKGIDLKREAKRLQNIEFSPAAEKPPPNEPVRPKVTQFDRLLREAELLLQEDQSSKARQKFLEALEEAGDRSAEVHYGLGRVALSEGDPDLARSSFDQAVEANPDTYIRAMSHVYIARIEDVLGNREEAVKHYQLALDSGEPSERVRGLAQQGLKEPFGRPRDEDPEDDKSIRN